MSAMVNSPPARYAPELFALSTREPDVRVLTWRTLARIAATPEQVLNVTVLPLVLILLFSYVFNGAIILPGHGDYRDYLIAGIIAVNMGGSQLLGNPDPAVAIKAWPMQHPELASALWSLALLAMIAPLTVWLYVRRNRR